MLTITTGRLYDAIGRILQVSSTNGAFGDVQDLIFAWGDMGNLDSGLELSGNKNLLESFGYDDLNRLESALIAGQTAITIIYDSRGNISDKPDVGTYGNDDADLPHAVKDIDGDIYSDDASGNNTSSNDRTINYTGFDKPASIIKGVHTTSFRDAPDRARYQRLNNNASGITTKKYLGSVEKIIGPLGSV
ncbi:MAG: hypothetical protein KUG79_18090 [Pseudomonadales bacterium]|nr:hypothetical protein [Pseudomonadales bacterium]